MKRARAILGLGIAAVVGAHASAASAGAPHPTVAVVCGDCDALSRRVRAELEALGFRVSTVHPAGEAASRASLEAQAREAKAIAAIRSVPASGSVEVWIADRVTGKTVLRATSTTPAPSADPAAQDGADAALALRVVELLRASLLETGVRARREGEVDATPDDVESLDVAPARAPEQAPPRLRVSANAGALWGAGGFDAIASLDLGLAWMATDHVGITGFVAIPLSQPSVGDAMGSASLSAWLAGGGLRFVPVAPTSRWVPNIDVGLAAAVLHATGASPAPGFGAQSQGGASAVPYARVGCAYAPTTTFRLRADLLVGTAARGTSIRFAQNEIARWGQPLVLAGAGADFGWF